MKVVYVKTVVEQVIEARHAALMDSREIKKIVLTGAEAEQLKAEISPLSWSFTEASKIMSCRFGCLPENTKVCGILIESEVK